MEHSDGIVLKIYGLNNIVAQATIKNRQSVINEAGGEQVSFTKFHDVRQDIAMESHQAAIRHAKGGK